MCFVAYVKRFCRHSFPKVEALNSLSGPPVKVIFSTLVLLLCSQVATVPSVAQSCPVNTPHIQGVWRTLPYLMPINPISATLLHTGKVLIVAGSENDASNNSTGAESYRNAVWDPTAPTGNGITVQEIQYDVFCSGTAALPDGRSLVIGGTSDYSFKGDNRASIFDPVTTQFVQSQSMVNGRWYGSATALGDGRVMAFSGLNLSGGTNNTTEIYDLQNAGQVGRARLPLPFLLLFTHECSCCRVETCFMRGRSHPCLDILIRGLGPGAVGDKHDEQVLRFQCSSSTSSAQLYAESDEFRRWWQSCDIQHGDHRSFRRHAKLETGTEHVNGPHSDECDHPAEWQGACRGRLVE